MKATQTILIIKGEKEDLERAVSLMDIDKRLITMSEGTITVPFGRISTIKREWRKISYYVTKLNFFIQRQIVSLMVNKDKTVSVVDKELVGSKIKLVERPLKEQWENYLDNGFNGELNDYWKSELEEIENKLPFKNKSEHDHWLQLGLTWNGESEWLEFTDELIQRYQKEKEEFIKKLMKN